MYSDVPIPTATISFRQSFMKSTNQHGCFALCWSPAYLATTFDANAISTNSSIPFLQPYSYHWTNIAFNNHPDLRCNQPSNAFEPIYNEYMPSVDLQKYRLVSA